MCVNSMIQGIAREEVYNVSSQHVWVAVVSMLLITQFQSRRRIEGVVPALSCAIGAVSCDPNHSGAGADTATDHSPLHLSSNPPPLRQVPGTNSSKINESARDLLCVQGRHPP